MGPLGCEWMRTFNQAKNICHYANARLCTVAELEAGCAAGTGCGHDYDLVWASAPSPPHPVVCGAPGDCSEAAGLKEVDELHEVRLQRIHPIARLRADCVP